MKKMKKLLSLMMALAMVFALAVSVNATEGEPATITIQNASKGATYTAYKLFDAKVNGNGGITYTGNIPSMLTEYFTKNANGEISATADAVVADSTETPKPLSTSAQAALKGWVAFETIKNEADRVYTKSGTGNGGPLTLHVPYGYYVITSSIDSGLYITVDSTNPNVSVYDKNNAGVPTFPDDAKKANNDIYYLGETVTYTIKLNTVNWIGAGETAKKVTSYTITDDFAEGKLTNVNVTGIKVDGTAITTQQFNNNAMTIKWVDNNKNSLYDNDAQIEITYTAVVASTEMTITNKLSATYRIDGDTEDTPVDRNPTEDIHTAKITVTKIDGEGKALAGAGFVLQGSEGYYKKADDGKSISWVSDISNATELSSTADSNVMVFDGLKNGTYTLIENTVPDGYNKAANQEITINDNDVTSTNLQKEATVENLTGAELPETGGIGTTIFTITGSVLMVGAAILFITKKRSEDCAN